ncbi:MAG: M15 family metallopeptidase [Bacteroidota bacterium]
MPRLLPVLLLLVPVVATAQTGPPVPEDFVRLRDLDSTIVEDIRYTTPNNFVGRPIHGYEAPVCYLSRPAAEALVRVQADLRAEGLTLKVFDCYRPQRAVNHFVRWAQDRADTVRQAYQYPAVPKGRLFADGYIASRSGHSRGSTVDLTIVDPADPRLGLPDGHDPYACDDPSAPTRQHVYDMGTDYDCFSVRSHTAHPSLTERQQANRQRLKAIMDRHGFRNYSKEWWHYTLRGEPHPDHYFDFVVR